MMILMLCREYELWFVLGTPPSFTDGVRNRIVPHVYLGVVAYKWWNHELWLVTTKDILRSYFKDVEHG